MVMVVMLLPLVLESISSLLRIVVDREKTMVKHEVVMVTVMVVAVVVVTRALMMKSRPLFPLSSLSSSSSCPFYVLFSFLSSRS